MGRSLKAQMKYANKINARYVVVLGEEEIMNKNKGQRHEQRQEEEIS